MTMKQVMHQRGVVWGQAPCRTRHAFRERENVSNAVLPGDKDLGTKSIGRVSQFGETVRRARCLHA